MPQNDFSILSMFMGADFLVKSVMLLLVGASIWCWGVIFTKYRALRTIVRSSNRFERDFWSDKSLKQIYDALPDDEATPMSAVFLAGLEEYLRLSKLYSGQDLQNHLERVMSITANREIEDLQDGTNFLATIGSTAPFIGLFGTVWGIMHSFQGIAAMQSTNLAVVAPGIAEALLATALGLAAAIPAVMGYNKITTEIDRYNGRLDAFMQELSSRLTYQKETKRAL